MESNEGRTEAELETATVEAQPPTLTDQVVDTAADEAIEPVTVSIVSLERARALPEAKGDFAHEQIAYDPAGIEQFMDEDGRTMRIVQIAGALAKTEVSTSTESED